MPRITDEDTGLSVNITGGAAGDLSSIASTTPTRGDVDLNNNKLINVTAGGFGSDAARVDQVPTNKLPPRVVSYPFAATITPNPSTTDDMIIGQVTSNFTMANPAAGAYDGQTVSMRFNTDAVAGHVVTWGTAYKFGTNITSAQVASDMATANANFDVLWKWDLAYSKWKCVGLVGGF